MFASLSEEGVMETQQSSYSLGLLRITLGLIFLWAFFDKVFGLGFSTKPDMSWIAGTSPTSGFFTNVAHGPLAPVYQSLAGIVLIDWIFMLALLLIGTTLTLGIAIRLGSYTGAILSFLMWSALIPPDHHPFLDEHIVYVFAFLVIAAYRSHMPLSMSAWWSRCSLVKKYHFLQ